MCSYKVTLEINRSTRIERFKSKASIRLNAREQKRHALLQRHGQQAQRLRRLHHEVAFKVSRNAFHQRFAEAKRLLGDGVQANGVFRMVVFALVSAFLLLRVELFLLLSNFRGG